MLVQKPPKPSSNIWSTILPWLSVLCALILLLLVAGVIVLALIPLYVQAGDVPSINPNRSTVYLTVNYGTNMTSTRTLTESELDTFASRVINTYALSGISLTSAQFHHEVVDSRKRSINNYLCDNDPGTPDDLFSTTMTIQCGRGCFTEVCRRRCLERVQSRLVHDHPRFTIPLASSNSKTEYVRLSYCSIGTLPLTEHVELQPYINALLQELQSTSFDAILYWNLVALHANANDYNRAISFPPSQPGPMLTSRAYAIIHGAMYDAFAGFNPEHQRVFHTINLPAIEGVSRTDASNAAIMEAAYQTLSALFPVQKPLFDAARNYFLREMRKASASEEAVQRGITVGQLIAKSILTIRGRDGSNRTASYVPTSLPGYHQVDPLHPQQGFLAPHWGNVTPFLIRSAVEFRSSSIVGTTPAERLNFLRSSRNLQNFEEVKSLGAKVNSTRTPDQEEIGIFWAYDGAPKIGTPPRLYSQVARAISIQQKNTLEQNARLMAMVHYAMADVGIACWESKYFYDLWRPIVEIRATADPTWEPLGAPSDGIGTSFTPNFPSYPSGHASFGSSVFELLRLFYGRDDIAFRLTSDEYNGKTIDSSTQLPRPIRRRAYTSFTQAMVENTLSRIYLGIHQRIDQEEGDLQGIRVGKYIFDHFP